MYQKETNFMKWWNEIGQMGSQKLQLGSKKASDSLKKARLGKVSSLGGNSQFWAE